jgi:adenine-specific DNA glycosylase
MTNRPNSVNSSTVIPGISDHDIAQIELDINPVRTIKKPRQIPMYKRARWEDFKQSMTEVGASIMAAPADSDIEPLWEKFRDAIRTGTNKYIPHKPQKAKLGQPYIDIAIRRLIRKSDRLYD